MPTVDDTTQINPRTTVRQLCTDMEGERYESSSENPRIFECDFCSTGVPYASDPTIGYYIADDVLNPADQTPHARHVRQNRVLVPLAAYCEDCTTKRLLFPCEGVAEVRALFELDGDQQMVNFRVTDVSPRDDGIPWDPADLSEQISGVPFLLNAMYADVNWLWGPENMITFFLSMQSGIDIRELVQWDGSYDPKLLGQARRKFDAFAAKMAGSDYSRKKYRDHVRGETDS